MRTFVIIARVRRRGAIGIFYLRPFEVNAADVAGARSAWFNWHGDEWELNNFDSIAERE